MSVRVVVAGSGKTLELDCASNTRVEALQQALASLTGIPLARQLLMAGGEHLRSSERVGAHGSLAQRLEPRPGQPAGPAPEVFLYDKALMRGTLPAEEEGLGTNEELPQRERDEEEGEDGWLEGEPSDGLDGPILPAPSAGSAGTAPSPGSGPRVLAQLRALHARASNDYLHARELDEARARWAAAALRLTAEQDAQAAAVDEALDASRAPLDDCLATLRRFSDTARLEAARREDALADVPADVRALERVILPPPLQEGGGSGPASSVLRSGSLMGRPPQAAAVGLGATGSSPGGAATAPPPAAQAGASAFGPSSTRSDSGNGWGSSARGPGALAWSRAPPPSDAGGAAAGGPLETRLDSSAAVSPSSSPGRRPGASQPIPAADSQRGSPAGGGSLLQLASSLGQGSLGRGSLGRLSSLGQGILQSYGSGLGLGSLGARAGNRGASPSASQAGGRGGGRGASPSASQASGGIAGPPPGAGSAPAPDAPANPRHRAASSPTAPPRPLRTLADLLDRRAVKAAAEEVARDGRALDAQAGALDGVRASLEADAEALFGRRPSVDVAQLASEVGAAVADGGERSERALAALAAALDEAGSLLAGAEAVAAGAPGGAGGPETSPGPGAEAGTQDEGEGAASALTAPSAGPSPGPAEGADFEPSPSPPRSPTVSPRSPLRGPTSASPEPPSASPPAPAPASPPPPGRAVPRPPPAASPPSSPSSPRLPPRRLSSERLAAELGALRERVRAGRAVAEASDAALDTLAAARHALACKQLMTRDVAAALSQLARLQGDVARSRLRLRSASALEGRVHDGMRALARPRALAGAYARALAEAARRAEFSRRYEAHAGALAERMAAYREREIESRARFRGLAEGAVPAVALARLGLQAAPPICEVGLRADPSAPPPYEASSDEMAALAFPWDAATAAAPRPAAAPAPPRDASGSPDGTGSADALARPGSGATPPPPEPSQAGRGTPTPPSPHLPASLPPSASFLAGPSGGSAGDAALSSGSADSVGEPEVVAALRLELSRARAEIAARDAAVASLRVRLARRDAGGRRAPRSQPAWPGSEAAARPDGWPNADADGEGQTGGDSETGGDDGASPAPAPADVPVPAVVPTPAPAPVPIPPPAPPPALSLGDAGVAAGPAGGAVQDAPASGVVPDAPLPHASSSLELPPRGAATPWPQLQTRTEDPAPPGPFPVPALPGDPVSSGEASSPSPAAGGSAGGLGSPLETTPPDGAPTSPADGDSGAGPVDLGASTTAVGDGEVGGAPAAPAPPAPPPPARLGAWPAHPSASPPAARRPFWASDPPAASRAVAPGHGGPEPLPPTRRAHRSASPPSSADIPRDSPPSDRSPAEAFALRPSIEDLLASAHIGESSELGDDGIPRALPRRANGYDSSDSGGEPAVESPVRATDAPEPLPLTPAPAALSASAEMARARGGSEPPLGDDEGGVPDVPDVLGLDTDLAASQASAVGSSGDALEDGVGRLALSRATGTPAVPLAELVRDEEGPPTDLAPAGAGEAAEPADEADAPIPAGEPLRNPGDAPSLALPREGSADQPTPLEAPEAESEGSDVEGIEVVTDSEAE